MNQSVGDSCRASVKKISEIYNMPQKSLILHPISLFSSTWLVVAGLYEMHLSKLLIATNSAVASTISLIISPFIVVGLLLTLYFAFAPKASIRRNQLLNGMDDPADILVLKKRLNRWLVFWGCATAVEIIVSGGIPFVWLLTGSSKVYTDFGIQSVHGLLNSLLLSIGLCYAGLFARFGDRKNLRCPTGIFIWAILTITRGMVIINMLQVVIITLLYRGLSIKFAFKLIAIALVVVVAFGIIGDFRAGGGSVFLDLAQPTEAYPEWLPSGDLWVYIYLTTPLNNLIYSSRSLRPLNDATFPNTAAPLFPSVLRNRIYGEDLSESVSGELVDSAFNVSTAYVGPYQDYGAIGIACLSLLMGICSTIYWKRNNFRDVLIYAVLGQCLVITVFGDNFLSLPVISQLIWIYLFFHRATPAKITASVANGKSLPCNSSAASGKILS